MTIRIKDDGNVAEGSYSFNTKSKIYYLKGEFWFENTHQ